MSDKKQYSTFTASDDQMTVEQKRAMPTSHKPWFLALVIANVIVLLIIFAFNGLSATGAAPFVSTPGDQADKFELDITPAGWTFSIWGVIYTWQALWVLYSVVNLFRQSPGGGGPVYLTPAFLPPLLFGAYILASASNVSWLLLFDRDYIEASFVALLLLTFFLVAGLVLSYRALDSSIPELVSQGQRKDIWLVRGLVHNGLAVYATWGSIATWLNLAMVITYSDGSTVAMPTASTVALSLLTVELLAFVVTDLVFLDRYSRYTLTPYAVFVVALIGSISKNWDAGATNSVFSAVLLALAGVAALLKVVLTLYRHCTRQPYSGVAISPTLGGGKA